MRQPGRHRARAGLLRDAHRDRARGGEADHARGRRQRGRSHGRGSRDYDDLIDCEDPSTCQSSAACTPGATAHGGACTQHSDCVANMNDPFCATEADTGYFGGFCMEFCDLMNDDCGADALCADLGLPSGAGLCIETCATDTDCRQPTYSCQDFGLAQSVCQPETYTMTLALQ